VESVAEATLRDLLAHAEAGVTVFTADRRFLMVNDQYLRLTGYTREEAMTHRAGDSLRADPLDQERFLALITDAISAGEADIVLKNGQPLAVEFVVIPTTIDGARAFIGIMWPLVTGHARPSMHYDEPRNTEP
jgi:PAS domain S-box-containing protein